MPFKVIESGNTLRVNDDGSYLYKLSKAEAISYFENMQDGMKIQVEGRRSGEGQAGRKWQVQVSGGQRSSEPREAKAVTTPQDQDRSDKAEVCRRRKRELDGSGNGREKVIERAQTRERKEKKRQLYKELDALTEWKQDAGNMMEVLRLEKKCLDRDRAELIKQKQRLQAHLEQTALVRNLIKTEILKQKEYIQTQQDALVMAKLEFEVEKIAQSEEARKTNAKILERDRVVQEMEARDREDLWISEAQRMLNEADRRQKAARDASMDDMKARVDRLGEYEVRVNAAIENNRNIERKLEEVKNMLTRIEEDAEIYGMMDDHGMNSLSMEHEAEQSASQADLGKGLEDAPFKGQELQDLPFRLAEEDLERHRDRAVCHAESSANKEIC
ncbi:hypothetical protein VTL71DRAFT_1571 [Oculimacula yallundae]|uniref:Uncharacterized protein n=1 Tax=Oculimacula yallundae TaxID=86028 RepID=A0ABR4CB30_9HELO